MLLLYMYVAEIQGDALQRQVYLACHEVEVIDGAAGSVVGDKIDAANRRVIDYLLGKQ